MNQPDENNTIEKLLPYRSSTLLITDLVSYDPDQGVTCGLELRGSEYYFRGHFPGEPMLPGVLELEAMFQAACLWHALEERVKNPLKKKTIPGLVLSGIRSARFQQIIIPPQSVEITVRVENRTDDEVVFFGSITSRENESQQTFASALLHTTLSG